MERYKDKTILITGASSGIGKAFARRLDELGANIILTARSEDKLIELASKMHNACVISGDLSDREFSNKLYHSVKEKDLQVDILINNAGLQYRDNCESFPLEKWDELLEINLTAVFFLFGFVHPSCTL